MVDSAPVISVFGDVLARMAFLSGHPVSKADLPRPGSARLVHMGFEGPMRGTLALAIPTALCTQLAANLLGLDEADPRAEAAGLEAAQELLNVTCGHVLVALAGDEPVFDLSTPRGEGLDGDGWDALLATPGSCALLVEDEHPVLLRVAIEA
jgi:hypothetical protein